MCASKSNAIGRAFETIKCTALLVALASCGESPGGMLAPEGPNERASELLGGQGAAAASLTLVESPGNGHVYELVHVPSGLDWYEARDAAASSVYNGLQGHLATITSRQEDEFVADAFPDLGPNRVFSGGTDEGEEGAWRWITGEEWDYSNWYAGEPNGGTAENCLDYDDDIVQWNDVACSRMLFYYLVEYERVLVESPDNGNIYELVHVPSGLDWYEARDAAASSVYNGLQGHLAAITSRQEDEFVAEAFPDLEPNRVFLGGTDEGEEAVWRWITGEEWDYSNWDAGEPNGGTAENCLDYDDDIVQWNDVACSRTLFYYLVEYERILAPDCRRGGWRGIGFKNQGQCVRFSNTGKDSRADPR